VPEPEARREVKPRDVARPDTRREDRVTLSREGRAAFARDSANADREQTETVRLRGNRSMTVAAQLVYNRRGVLTPSVSTHRTAVIEAVSPEGSRQTAARLNVRVGRTIDAEV